MRLRLLITFLCFTPTLALANACTYSGASGNFRTVAWVSCGGTYPQGADTAAISGAGVVVTIPLSETDSIGTTGGTTPHPVLTVSGGAGLVILGTLTAGNQSGVQTNDIKVTGSGSFMLNRGTFSQQGDLDLDTSAEFDACAGGVHAVVSSGTTILNRITGTGTALPYPLWNMHSTRCATYGGAIPSSPIGVPCTDAGGGANCYHMQVPAGTAFQFGLGTYYLVFDANSLVFDSPNSTYGTCGTATALCLYAVGFWCRNTSFNFTGELGYTSYGTANDPGLDWSADAYGQGCDYRNPLSTVGLFCQPNSNPGTYDRGTGRQPSPRRIEWATFDVDAGEHNRGYTNSNCPGLDVNNIVSSAEFSSQASGSQINTNFHDMLFLRAYNFIDTYAAYFLPGAGFTFTNLGALVQGPKISSPHSHMFSEGPPAGANSGQNFTTCNIYKNLFFEGAGDQLSHDNMMVNSTCLRYQGGIFDHNFTNFIDNNNPSTQCNSCNSSGAEHVTIVDNNNVSDPTGVGFEPWEVQAGFNRLGINKVEEINSFLAQSATNVIGHTASTYSNNTAIFWTEQPAYGSANITSVVVANPNMTINVDDSTPFQSSTHGQVNLISLTGNAAGGNESTGNCTVGTILQINSGNNDATFQVTSTSGSPGPITGYTIVTPGTGYTAARYTVVYTTTVVGGTGCSATPIVSVATGDVWARLGCTMQTGYGIQSTAATVLNCHHLFVTATTPTSVTAAIPPGVTLADGTYTTTGIIEKGFNYDYNVGGDWQSRASCGTPNLWNTAAGGIDGIPYGDPNIASSCNWVSFGTFTAASNCTSPCTSLSANAVTGHPFAVNQVVIDRTSGSTTTALITAVSGTGPYTLTLGPNNQTGAAGLPFTVNTSDVLVLMRGIWDSTAPAFGTATHYGANDVTASPQLAYSSFTPGKITGITLTAGGTGYVQGTVYFLSGGTDPGAITATTVVGGAITVATLAYGGSGYSSGQVLTVVGGSGDATVTVTAVQASCNLATWDKSLGGVGSWANAKKMLIAMNGHDQAGNTVTLNPEYNLQNFFAYKAECYKFYNTSLNGKGAQGTDPGFAPNAVDPAIGKITDNYILSGATPTVNGAGENVFTNQAGQVHKGGHGQLTLSSAPRICADALDPCTALTVSPVVLAGQYYHFTANGPAAITWSVSGDTNSSITPQTGVYTRTGTPTGTITVTATNLAGSSSIVVLPSGTIPDPTCLPAAGTYLSGQNVTCVDSDGAATLCYTVNGTTPTTNGGGSCTGATLTYSAPIAISSTATIKIVATKAANTTSSIVSFAYTITGPVTPVPLASLAIYTDVTTSSPFNTNSGTKAQRIADFTAWAWSHAGTVVSGHNDLSPNRSAGQYWVTYTDGAYMYTGTLYPNIFGVAATQGFSNPENMLVHYSSDHVPGHAQNTRDQFDIYEPTAASLLGCPSGNTGCLAGLPSASVNGVMNWQSGAYVDRTVDAYCPTGGIVPADAACTSHIAAPLTVNDHLLLGRQVPFYQINVTVTSALAGGTATWQYWNGSAYVTLTTSSDTTSGLTTTGTVSFVPPSGWARNVDQGSNAKYHVILAISPGGSVGIGRIYTDNMTTGSSNRGWNTATCTGLVNAGTDVAYCPTPNAPTSSAKLRQEARVTGGTGTNGYFGNQLDVQNSKYTWAYAVTSMADLTIAATYPNMNAQVYDDAGLAPPFPTDTEYGSTSYATASNTFFPKLYTVYSAEHPIQAQLMNPGCTSAQFQLNMSMDGVTCEKTYQSYNQVAFTTDLPLNLCNNLLWCPATPVGPGLGNNGGGSNNSYGHNGVWMLSQEWDVNQHFQVEDNDSQCQHPTDTCDVTHWHQWDMGTTAPTSAYAAYLLNVNPNVAFLYSPQGSGSLPSQDEYYHWATSTATLVSIIQNGLPVTTPTLCTLALPCTVNISGALGPSGCPSADAIGTLGSDCPLRIGGVDVVDSRQTDNGYTGTHFLINVTGYSNPPAPILHVHSAGETIEYMVRGFQAEEDPKLHPPFAYGGQYLPFQSVNIGVPDNTSAYYSPCKATGGSSTPFSYLYCRWFAGTAISGNPTLCSNTGLPHGTCADLLRRDFTGGTFGKTIVLQRPLGISTAPLGNTAGSEFSTPAQAQSLPATYYALKVDGTVDTTPVTFVGCTSPTVPSGCSSVLLRAGESFIGVTQTQANQVNQVLSSGATLSSGGVIR